MRPAAARHGGLLAAVLLLAACAGDGRAGELACQRRLVDIADGRGQPRLLRGENAMAATFRATGERFGRMSGEGCTEAQRLRATNMARLSAVLAATAARLGDPVRMAEQSPGSMNGPLFLELKHRIERYEGHRLAMREELARMSADR